MERSEAIDTVKLYWPIDEGGPVLREAIETLIPELKESEDERIRKNIITFLDELFSLGKNTNFDKWSKSDCAKWTAWLVKQGSQNLANSAKTCKVEPKFMIGDKIKFAGEPDRCAEKIIAIRDDAYYFSEVVSLPFIEQDKWELAGQKPADKVEQNPVWSKEDEKIRQDIENLICFALRDGSAVAPAADTTKENALDWLKSLKERYTWKPSKTQIDALESAIDALDAKDDGLVFLYNDLKKLKG